MKRSIINIAMFTTLDIDGRAKFFRIFTYHSTIIYGFSVTK